MGTLSETAALCGCGGCALHNSRHCHSTVIHVKGGAWNAAVHKWHSHTGRACFQECSLRNQGPSWWWSLVLRPWSVSTVCLLLVILQPLCELRDLRDEETGKSLSKSTQLPGQNRGSNPASWLPGRAITSQTPDSQDRAITSQTPDSQTLVEAPPSGTWGVFGSKRESQVAPPLWH